MSAIDGTNEPGPAEGDKKIEQNVVNNFDKQYAEMLKKEQEALESKQRGETALQFDNVRKLGFATKADMDESIKGIFGKFVSELEAMRQENTKLREWVMRAKAQGLTGSALEQSQDQPDSQLKEFERPFFKNMRK